jgi:quercetin dioxygenase-like cupin family protein
MRPHEHRMLTAFIGVFMTVTIGAPALGAPEGTEGRCIPVSERAGRESGCFIIAEQRLGRLSQRQMFWHLDTYATRAEAEAARGPRGTVVASLGKVWLFTIAEAGWRPARGERVAEIGPLPVRPDLEYTADYREAIFPPGMKSIVHRHSGPEAWYTLAGETCLETPEAVFHGRPGGPPVVVQGGLPMELTATGSEVRRAVLLVLHDSGRPSGSLAPDWSPKGLCRD